MLTFPSPTIKHLTGACNLESVSKQPAYVVLTEGQTGGRNMRLQICPG